MTEKSTTAPLSLVEKVGYGAGDMASNFYMGVINVFLLYYYTDVWGLDPADAAFMFLITKVVDAVSDPAMGLIADRSMSRWGRYRPYLLWVAIPLGLLGYVLFLGPDLSSTGKLIFAYASYTLVMLAYTAINVPYSALLAVIHPKAEERTKATQYRFIFASLGTLVVGATTKPLVDYLGAGDEVQGFRLAMILFSVISIALFWFTFATTRERIQPVKQASNVREEIGVLLKNVSWIALAISGICVVVGLVARISSTAFYGKYYLVLGEAKYLWWMDGTTLIITAGFLGQLVGALLTPSLLKLLEKKTLMVWTNFGCAVSIVATYALEPHQFGLTLVLHTVGIFAFGIIITLLFAMYTDCAEYGEWVSGKNSAGLTVSASMFSLKAGSAIGSAIPAALLAMYGFVQGAEAQSAEAIQGIQVMYNLLPAVFFIAAGVIMFWYKIDSALLQRIEEELSQKRAAN
ncbi:MAG: MFS transporter [Myxococcota bacterium]|nr:MFS transporter [Myxococcota bacterium]